MIARLALSALAVLPVAVLPVSVQAQPLACSLPAQAAAAPAAPQDGPTRVLPITGYTLALTWAPDFCSTHAGEAEAAAECGTGKARFGFVLHGLWPDSAGGTWPQWCPIVAPADGTVPAGVVRAMACTTPSPSLLAHEWARHGACMAPNPQVYFDQAARLYHRLRFPALARQDHSTAGAIRTAFAAANPGLPRTAIAVLVSQGGALQEVHLCLDRRFGWASCGAKGAPDSAPARIAR